MRAKRSYAFPQGKLLERKQRSGYKAPLRKGSCRGICAETEGSWRSVSAVRLSDAATAPPTSLRSATSPCAGEAGGANSGAYFKPSS